MKMDHLLIEGFCDGDKNQKAYPCKGTLKFGVHCIGCPKFSYTFCSNEMAISDVNGVVEYCIGFGGNMEPTDVEKREEYIATWNRICKEKIDEAYDEFMKQIKQMET